MSEGRSRGLTVVRYGVPTVIACAGVLALALNRTITGLEGFAMGIGVAASVLLLNVLYRAGVTGDSERDREEEARAYFDTHGHWPDEGEGEGGAALPDAGTARPVEQPPRERPDSSRYGPPPIEAPPPRLRRAPRRRGE